MLTLSGLQLAAICPGAAVLPRIGHVNKSADIGSALHEYNAVLGERGRGDADGAAYDIATRWSLDGRDRAMFFSRARAFSPDIPDGALYELPLCLRADGTVEPVVGGHGSYDAPDDAIVSGTLDIVFASPRPIADGRCQERSVLWTPDLKTGADANVAPIDRNLQARASALLGSRYFGADFVVPAILYLDPGGGRWDVPLDAFGQARPLRSAELDQVETDLRTLAANVAEQRRRYLAGGVPKLVTGAHCTYCAARPGCPAHVAEVRALVTGTANLAQGELTQEQAEKLAGMVGPAAAMLKAAKDALKMYGQTHGPIPLPGGKVYGPRKGTETRFAVRATYDAIRAELDPVVGPEKGAEVADLAFDTCKEGVYDAIRAAHEAAGIKRKMKAAYERIIANEGVCSTVVTEEWSAHYPKTEAAAVPELKQ